MPNGFLKVSIHHPLGFNWHPLEGALIDLYPHTLTVVQTAGVWNYSLATSMKPRNSWSISLRRLGGGVGHEVLEVYTPVNQHSHGKSTILMVFTRKNGWIFMGYVSFREGNLRMLKVNELNMLVHLIAIYQLVNVIPLHGRFSQKLAFDWEKSGTCLCSIFRLNL